MGGGGKQSAPQPLPPVADPVTPAASPEAKKARKRKEQQAALAFGRQGTIQNVGGSLGLVGGGGAASRTLLGN